MPEINGIMVDVFEDSGMAGPPERPLAGPTRLPYDLFLDDPETGESLWFYAAGTAVESFRERVVDLPPAGPGPAVTTLTVRALHRGATEPVPFAVFRFPHDIRGQRLAFRFARPFSEGRLRVESDTAEGTLV